MIRHIVLLDLPKDHDRDALEKIMTGLAGLQDEISGFVQFSHGPNRDCEGMSPNCAYAFTCDFASAKTSHAYLDNPTHQAFGKRLVALCRGGAAGITVIDVEITT